MTATLELEDGVARVTIRRPERMNAVDAATTARLEDIWSQIEAERSVRCVVLTGEGEKAFSAGADMKSAGGKSGLEYWASGSPNGFGGITFRDSLKVPVIARVNGLALGGGMEMVLGADIVVAADHARFGLTEARVGRLPLDGGMIMLQRLIPRNIAAGMMLTGRMVGASEMAGFGLVNAVVPMAELDAEVGRWIADIRNCAPLSLRAIKAVIRRTAQLSAKEAFATKLPELLEALGSEDQNEGVAAFVEKRAPVWKGR